MTLLSDAEIREYVTTTLDETALAVFLDAAEAAIAAMYGPVGSDFTEVVDGGLTYVFLRRRASAVTEVKETDGETETTLAVDDWRLRADGVSVKRLGLGTNPRTYWGMPVSVKYSPADDLADRKRVQIALVTLDLNHKPGAAASERIGEWEERASTGNSVWNYETERASILASIGNVVGSAPGFA